MDNGYFKNPRASARGVVNRDLLNIDRLINLFFYDQDNGLFTYVDTSGRRLHKSDKAMREVQRLGQELEQTKGESNEP